MNGWDELPTTALKVERGFNLADFDPTSTPGFSGDKKAGKKLMIERGKLLSELQERFFANSKEGDNRKLLVVVQGLDTAGKGGIARHVLGMVDPQGVAMASFGVPTEEELAKDFLWRITQKLPPAGKIGLFDRSHYEDVLAQRVLAIVAPEVWEARYDKINAWEKKLVDKENFTIIKLALMVSHTEQGIRLAERLVRPDKWWKYEASDINTRLKWDDYQEAYQAVFDRTSTDWAPWYVVPADKKWYLRLAVTELIIQALIAFNQSWPQADFDVTVEKERLVATMTEEDRQLVREELAGKAASVAADEAAFNAAVAAAKVGQVEKL